MSDLGLSFSDRFSAATIAAGNGIFSGSNSSDLVTPPPFDVGKLPKISGATINALMPSISGSTLSTADAGASSAAPSNAGAGSAASGGLGAFLGSYFLRGTIIVLGFVFVAVGLTMFKGNQIQLVR